MVTLVTWEKELYISLFLSVAEGSIAPGQAVAFCCVSANLKSTPWCSQEADS